MDSGKNVRRIALNGSYVIKQRTFSPARSAVRKASASELSKGQPHRCPSKFLPGWLAHLLCLVTNPSYFHQISWTCGVVVLISRDSSQTFALGKKSLCWRKSMTFRKCPRPKASCATTLVSWYWSDIFVVPTSNRYSRCVNYNVASPSIRYTNSDCG